MNEDLLDLLRCLLEARAPSLVVGAHALAVHGVPRATCALDVWIDRDAANAKRVWAAVLLVRSAGCFCLGFVDTKNSPSRHAAASFSNLASASAGLMKPIEECIRARL